MLASGVWMIILNYHLSLFKGLFQVLSFLPPEKSRASPYVSNQTFQIKQHPEIYWVRFTLYRKTQNREKIRRGEEGQQC